jgi:hypothetical protein
MPRTVVFLWNNKLTTLAWIVERLLAGVLAAWALHFSVGLEIYAAVP